jgi:glycosyltransferase involved in cell wall biosynthesis
LQEIEEINLAIVFLSNQEIYEFKYKKTIYYPVKRKKITFVKKYFNILKGNNLDIVNNNEFIKIINKFSPDIIHIHGTENIFGSILGKVQIPIVISIQGIVSAIYYKYNVASGYIDVNVAKNILYKLLGIKPFIITYKTLKNFASIEKETLKKTKYVIGRTSWDYKCMKTLAPKARYFTNNEILRDVFYKHIWSKPRRKEIIIMSTMGESFYKGLEQVCLTAGLLNSHNNIKIKFIWKIAGLEKEGLLVKATKKTVKCNEIKEIYYMGKLSDQELVKELLKSDIYVNVSHIENSSNSLSEALLLGVPSIATNVGGTSTLIKDGKTGILVPDGDPVSLAAAILELNNNYEKALFLSKNSRQEALKRHNKITIVTELLNIYKSILNEKSN